MAARTLQPTNDEVRRAGNRLFSRFAWENNVYLVPIDEEQQDCSEELDRLIDRSVFGSTVLVQGLSALQIGDDDDDAPVVLDCGCGRGAWITRFLDECDGEGDVTGIDLCFSQASADDDDDDELDEEEEEDDQEVQEFEKRRWNLNAEFTEAPWAFRLRPETFDLINSRMLAEGIGTDRWPQYIRKLCFMLKHGGWLQVVELQMLVQSWNGRLPRDSHLERWWTLYRQAGERLNRNPRVGLYLNELLRQAGLVNVAYRSIDVPIGAWKDGDEEVGEEVQPLVSTMLKSLSIGPFLKVLQIDRSTYHALLSGALAELSRAAEYKLYFKVYVATGRRGPRRR